jgi:hypothetical protein
MKHSLFIVTLIFVVVVIGYAVDDLGYWPAVASFLDVRP